MYEQFTDRAKKVMQLANQEAHRLNHDSVGTAHILLGLVKEGTGVAASVLNSLGVDLAKLRRHVEKVVGCGPQMVTMPRLPFTPGAKKVVEHSAEESRTLNHNFVGTEHLLLALLRDEQDVAARVLKDLGTRLKDVRQDVLALLGKGH